MRKGGRTIVKNSVINVHTDERTKQAIEALYGSFGITVSDAINIFLKKSLMEGGLPFEMRQPRSYRARESIMREARKLAGGKSQCALPVTMAAPGDEAVGTSSPENDYYGGQPRGFTSRCRAF
jgi:DNA-damage-inducible protein J